MLALVGWVAVSIVIFGLASTYRPFFMDDAYIGFQYIANLTSGKGFTFDGRTAVEGVSNSGWLLFLTPLAMIVGPTEAAKMLAPILIMVTLGIVAIPLKNALRIAYSPRTAIGGAAAAWVLLTITSSDYILFSLLGMETPLLTLILCAMLLLAEQEQRPALLGVLGALAFTIHPSAALVVPIYAAIMFAANPRARRDPLRMITGFATALLFVTLARWFYFGAVLPNTFHAKPLSSGALLLERSLILMSGDLANTPKLFGNPLAIAVVALGYVTLRRSAPRLADFAGSATLAAFIFCVYAAPDWTQKARYFAPFSPIAMLLVVFGVWELTRVAAQAHEKRAIVAAWCVTLAIAVPGFFMTIIPLSQNFHDKYPGYVLRTNTLIEPALWMKQNIESGAMIATRRIGVATYFGGHDVFDYTFGLADREVASLIRANGRQFDDPNDEALRDIWMKRRPEYILEDETQIEKFAPGGTRDKFNIHGIEYRVLRQFDIAKDVRWTLAKRVDPDR